MAKDETGEPPSFAMRGGWGLTGYPGAGNLGQLLRDLRGLQAEVSAQRLTALLY